MLTDIFLQAATAGSSVWMCSERHPSTPIPTPQMPGQGSQPEGAPRLGRRFKLDGVGKLPHALARAAQSTCSDLSIPDFLTRLEALPVSDCEWNTKRNILDLYIDLYIRLIFPAVRLLSSNTEVSTLQYSQVLFQSCGGTDLGWGVRCVVWVRHIPAQDTARREQRGCPHKLTFCPPWLIFCAFPSRPIFSHVLYKGYELFREVYLHPLLIACRFVHRFLPMHFCLHQDLHRTSSFSPKHAKSILNAKIRSVNPPV